MTRDSPTAPVLPQKNNMIGYQSQFAFFFWVMFFWILAKILCLYNTMLCGLEGGGRHATRPAWCERVRANQWPKDRDLHVSRQVWRKVAP